MKIIKNLSRNTIDTIYQGRRVFVASKGSLKAEDDLANYLLQTFGFLKDVTPKVNHPVGEVRKARGVRLTHDRT